jgi:hypothetical protein
MISQKQILTVLKHAFYVICSITYRYEGESVNKSQMKVKRLWWT